MVGRGYQGPTPVADSDFATVASARSRQPLSFMPSINAYMGPQGLLSYTTTPATRQRQSWYPFLVGPQGWTADAFVVNVTTASSGGSAPKLLLGLYKDDGTGFPDATQQVATATLTTLTVAKQVAAFSGGAVALAPGLYWICTIYDYTTVPSTAPQFNSNANSVWQFEAVSSVSFNPHRGLISTASTFTALPTSALTRSNFTICADSTIVIALLRRSA